MTPEAQLETVGSGLAPSGEGWFVVNAADARWVESPHFGAWTTFEGDARFPQVGVNITVLQPGQPVGMYHAEEDQEGFLVLQGSCLLLVEGEERRLRQWDFFHCPGWTEHILVGAGDGPCTLLAFGARPHRGLVYPRSELALRHGAGVEAETPEPDVAYAGRRGEDDVAFEPAWLPG